MRCFTAGLLTITLSMFAPFAFAWHDEGHAYSAIAAVETLPEDVPALFRTGAATIAHTAIDPDVFRHRKAPQLGDATISDHYLDLELLQGESLPAKRSEFIELCRKLDVDPFKAGMLPYAIAEHQQMLTLAFAEYRADPENAHVRAKCLVYAGLLAHYAADLHMPLHTTIHYNGRTDEHGHTQHRGIHARVDALPTKLPYNVMFAEPLPEPTAGFAPDRPLPFIMNEFDKSHALVDRVYALEDSIPELEAMALDDPAVRELTVDRMRASASFLANLYYTAWHNSAGIELPSWLDRKAFDAGFDRDAVPAQPTDE